MRRIINFTNMRGKMKIFKVIVVVCIVLIALLVLLIAVFRLMSSPGRGEEACREAGIPYPTVVAHRGASYMAPEETAPAFILAREIGAEYLEADIQRTRDGVLIALHDDTFERTTDIAAVFPARIKETVDRFTLAEIKKLDAGSWFNAQFPDRARKGFVGVRILTLDELIDIAESGENRPGLYLETKEADRFPGIEEDLVGLLRSRGWIGSPPRPPEGDNPARITVGYGPARIIFQSFEWKSLAALRALAPEVPRVYLMGEDEEKEKGWSRLLDEARDVDASIGPVGYLAFPWNIGAAHRRGMLVHVYTIDRVLHFRLFSLVAGADGFFTNRPDVLIEYYGKLLSARPEMMLQGYDHR